MGRNRSKISFIFRRNYMGLRSLKADQRIATTMALLALECFPHRRLKQMAQAVEMLFVRIRAFVLLGKTRKVISQCLN